MVILTFLITSSYLLTISYNSRQKNALNVRNKMLNFGRERLNLGT